MIKDRFFKKVFPSIAVISLLTISFYWIVFVPDENDEHHMNQICETKRTQVAGIVCGVGGHGIYQWVQIDKLKKSLSVSIAKIKFTKGFPIDYVDCRVGDSLIKEANSKEILIKRDTCIAVYILDCDD